VFLFTIPTQPLFFLPPFCGIANKASTFTSSVQDSSESMAKAKCCGGKQTAFFKIGTNASPLLLQLLATADTLYYRISTGTDP
jgi:hypothetical protein